MAKGPRTVQTAEQMRDVYQQLSDELYRAFDFFNTKYAEGKLPRPVLTVASAHKMKAHGWFCESQWKSGETIIHEIVMAGESLDRPITDVIGTLVHEMAHLDNFVEHGEVKDCTPQQRHNRIFKDKAEKYDLVVTSSKRFGSAHTTPNGNLLQVIQNELKPKSEVYQIYRDNFSKDTKDRKKYKTKLKPVLVSEETKEEMKQGAEEMGMTQKDFAQAAVSTFRQLGKNAKNAAELIFVKRKQFKNAAEIEAILMDILMPEKVEQVTEGTATEIEEAA